MRIIDPAGDGRFHRIALTGVLVFAVAACGGGSGSTSTTSAAPAATAPAAPEETAAASSAASADAAIKTVDVDQEAWFAGFHVTFGKATSEITPERGGTVSINAKFENTGDDSGRLDGTLTLTSAGETAAEDDFGMDIPSVPGGQTGKGTLAFRVDDTFSFDDAVLTLGRPGIQQAVIPLAGGTRAVTLEPVDLSVSGSGKAGDLALALRGGELRADAPWKHRQQEQGSLILTVTYDATFDSGFAGGFAFTAENVALKLPDGTTVGVIQDGQSQSNELLGPKTTTKDLFSRFEVEDPAPGDYSLVVRSFSGAEAEIPFKIG